MGCRVRTAATLDATAAAPYWVELHKRLALPVAALVFVVVGFALGIRSHRGGRAVALAASFGIVASYYILITSLEGMALNRRLPAGLAIWLPNALFLALGAGLLRLTVLGIPSAWGERLWGLTARLPRGWPGWIGWPRWASRAALLLDRLDASAAHWTGDGWRLRNGVLRRVDAADRVQSERFDQRMVDMPEHIDDLTQLEKPPDSMSFLELRGYVKRLRESGHPVGRYLVELYAKLSFPLVHVIMALVAIPFALISPWNSGRAVGIGVAIVISVGYWVVHSIALAFARADLLPPALAAWTANIVFLGLGGALFLGART